MLPLLLLAPLVTAAAPTSPGLGSCTAELDARHVAYKPAARGTVEVTGTLGGIAIAADSLTIDCSLAVSLDEAGHYLRALGIERMTARHGAGAGLAIDLPSFAGARIGTLRVDRDFEPGLGDELDCVGAPATPAGAALAILKCQLIRSGLFRRVLTPDFDSAHADRFQLEAPPWSERTAVRSSLSAAH